MARRSETDGGWGEGGLAGGNAAERSGKDGAAEQGCVAGRDGVVRTSAIV